MKLAIPCNSIGARGCTVLVTIVNVAMLYFIGTRYYLEGQSALTDSISRNLSLPSSLQSEDLTHKVFENPEPLLSELVSFIGPARSIKIYVSPVIKNISRYSQKFPGNHFDLSSHTLDPAAPWFWVHDEYYANLYIMHRAHHDTRLFTENLTEADLCYPTCEDMIEFKPPRWDVSLKFMVTNRGASKLSGCKEIKIRIESPVSTCLFPVPYSHSIYATDWPSVAPWNLGAVRNNLLCFIGGVWRGNERGRIIAEMQTISNANRSHGKQQLFSAPFFFESHADEGGVWGTASFFARVWELYATSDFSWQPGGDTGTRRGFYDSWMLGCIPVVSESSAGTYRGLFRGRLFGAAGPPLEDVAVVLEDEAMRSGAAVLGRLAAIPAAEIRLRRRWLGRLAPVMQWGWDEGEHGADALLMALASVMAK